MPIPYAPMNVKSFMMNPLPIISTPGVKQREFVPSREELKKLMFLKDMPASISCYGGWNCKIAVTPTLTARVAVARLLSGMGLNPRHNKYALFEKLDNTNKVICITSNCEVISSYITSKCEVISSCITSKCEVISRQHIQGRYIPELLVYFIVHLLWHLVL